MSAHARVAPSALHMTVPCPGSLTMQEGIPPEPETEESAEGTAAHWVAMKAAKGEFLPVGHEFTSGDQQWKVTSDMHLGARMYAHALGGNHSALRAEEAINIPWFRECWGTPDAWRYIPEGTGPHKIPVIRVGDYKYGHRFVEVYENLQLTAYGFGLIAFLLHVQDLLQLPHVVFEFILVQPRAYHREGPVRTWRVAAHEILHLVAKIEAAVQEALGPNPRTQTGAHCLDCRARHVCKTLQQSAGRIVDYTGAPEPVSMSPEAMGVELRILYDARQRLKARYEGLEAQVDAMLRNGQVVPYWKLAPKRSVYDWNENATVDEVGGLGDLFNIPLRKPLALITPTQAIDAGVDPTIISQYATRRPGGVSLKPDEAMDARKVFGFVKSND